MRVDRALVSSIETTASLDHWSDRIEAVVGPIVGSGFRRDALTGRWIGHPAHPMLVIVPMACWIGAAAVDVIGGPGSERIARRLVGLGVLTVVPAAATGSADWLDTDGAERRVGTVHAIANKLAVLAFGGSWLARRAGHRTLGRVLTGFGIGAVGCAGYLGGHLAYSRGVGVNTTAFQAGPDEWTALCPVDVVDHDGPTQARLGTVAFVVTRRGDRFDVLEDRCTHRGGPLSDGQVDDGCIECPWHGSRFATDTGAVAAGPASIPQPAYESRVNDDMLEIRRSEHGGLRRNPIGASTLPSTSDDSTTDDE